MSMEVMQHVVGVVYEMLHVLDPAKYAEKGLDLGYDLEAVLIVPQAYITLRTEELTGTEKPALLEAVSTAFTMVHGPEAIATIDCEFVMETLHTELVAFHAVLMNHTAEVAAVVAAHEAKSVENA